MNLEAYLEYLNSGKEIEAHSEVHKFMSHLSQEALRLTHKLNNTYRTTEEIRKIFSEIIGKPVHPSFSMFPPFYTDCGKNIAIGKNVFINSGCKFQDQGGITIEDGTFIGHNVVLATLNHNMLPEKRGNLIPKSIHIGKNVWIGAGVIVLPGVTIGDNSVIGAGSIVTKDIPANVVAFGNPCHVVREINERDKEYYYQERKINYEDL